MEAHEVLEQVKSGKMTVEEAEQFFKREPFEEMGYAKIDSHRKMRSGFAEVVFCQGKRDEFLLEIFQRIYKDEGEVMGTRASLAQYELLHKELPQVTYDPVSHILKIEKKDKKLQWTDSGMYGWNGRYCSGRRGCADGRVFRSQCGTYL